MDYPQIVQSDGNIDWEQAAQKYLSIIACENEPLQVNATLELARLSKQAPEATLASIIPVLVRLLGDSRPTIQAAASYALCCISRRVDGDLSSVVGAAGAIPIILRLLPSSRDWFRRTLLRCLSAVVSFDIPSRVILARIGGLEVILDLLGTCSGDMKRYLLEILSALALLREVRRVIINLGGLSFLIEAVSNGKIISRTRAAQAVGLLGIARRVRHMLVDMGAIQALVGLLRDGDTPARLVAGNALGIVSSHVDHLTQVAQADAIPLYVELLKGSEPLGKEIAEDVFSVLAVEEGNAILILEHLVRILHGEDEGAKVAAVDVLWDLVCYKHTLYIVLDSGVIPILVELLRNGNGDIRAKASGTIAQLSYEKASRNALAEAGAIPVLLDLLRGNSEELTGCTLEALINFGEDPLHQESVSDSPSSLAVQDRLTRIPASNEHMSRSMRLMNSEQLTSEPELI
ncbi:uncharacterized protein [Typha latifolia]|uniref:uncharacterized protein n=1 Tax=Typha latifolia TaxID=4733 RepID=UPI003C2DF055